MPAPIARTPSGPGVFGRAGQGRRRGVGAARVRPSTMAIARGARVRKERQGDSAFGRAVPGARR
eukprot:5727892-Lingulodinium_polyedra.AAC.1